MIAALKQMMQNRKRRSMVEELESLTAARETISHREKRLVNQIQAIDLQRTRQQVAAFRTRGY